MIDPTGDYLDYLDRCHATGRLPMRPDEFKRWAEIWDREYSALWENPGGPDWSRIRELEYHLCV